ncbi:hypothetical protein [Stenotrophomonas sp.]|uniref:hypothetical protein n=1 Tax=Stenotrophomonas sp. TaxID=69392 RepID=UPI0028AB9297|nr:hypothetical protein [Stenotrophomonas sp.]
MSKFQDVMSQATGLSSRDKACIQQTLGWMNSAGAGGIGNIVLRRLAALGASHAAVADLLKGTPGDTNLVALEKKVSRMIVDLGVAIGKCPAPPQGTALTSRESVVSDRVAAADECVQSCVSSIGGQKIMEVIGRVILPQPIMNALVEKRQDLVAKMSAEDPASTDLTQMVNAKALWALQNVVNTELDTSDPQAAVTAIIEVLKIPEYLVEGDPGKEGAQPSNEKGVSDLPPRLRELAGDGRNVAGNYNDFGSMGNKSTVDGANAAQLAELEVEKHRITIEGMLSAFKLGLEGSSRCGHLITGIHNPCGNVRHFAHEPLQAKTTGNIDIQTDPEENDQRNGNSVNFEFRQGVGNMPDGNDQGPGPLQPQPDPANAEADADAYTLVEGDALVGDDEAIDNMVIQNSAVRVNSQDDNARSPDPEVLGVEQNPVGDDDDVSIDTDTLVKRFEALRSNGFDNEDARERIETERLRQSDPPLTYVTETVNPSVQSLDAIKNQNPPLAKVLEDDAQLQKENTSRVDHGARIRTETITTSEDNGAAKDAAAKLFKPVNVKEELKVYFDGLSVHPMIRELVLHAPRRVVQGYQESVDAAGRREIKPVVQDASRFALNFGAHVMPSDLVNFKKEQGIIKEAASPVSLPSVESPEDEYLQFKRVINARDAAYAEGAGLGALNIRDELKRINAGLKQPLAPQKTFGRAFERADSWAEAVSKAVKPITGDAEARDQVTVTQNRMAAVGRWVQSQSPQMDPVEPKADVKRPIQPLIQPAPRIEASQAGIRDMLSNLLTTHVQRGPSPVDLFNGNAARGEKAAASHGTPNGQAAKFVRSDSALNSVGSSAAPSEASDDDSVRWDQGTPDQLMDEYSMQLDQMPHFVPNPEPLQEKPPIVLDERADMPIFSAGLTREQNLRMMQ